MVETDRVTMLLIAIIPTVLLIALGTWLALVLLMVRARLHPPRLTPIRALLMLGRAHPDDLGFAYTRLTFDVSYRRRPLRMAGYLVTHREAGGHLVIVLHGFADSSAGAAAWLPMLHRCAVNVLLLDMPAHGESDDAVCSAGWFEREALLQVITQVQSSHPQAAARITLLGISMGAATAMASACQDPRISGAIVDSPFASFSKACRLHARLFGLPGQVFQLPATWIIERWFGIRFAELAPATLVKEVPCPMLLIQAECDQFIASADAEAMHAAVDARKDGRSRAINIAGAGHVLSLAKSPEEYEQAVSHFLK